MKTLYFIRHGKSSWDDPTLRDHDRPLNKRGKRDAPRMAARLVGMAVAPAGILSSTAKRTVQTLKAFRKAMSLPAEQVLLRAELYHAGPEEIAAQIRELPAAWDTVLLFGHNPGYTELANRIPGEYIENVPTCGIVGARTDIADWSAFKWKQCRRICFMYPKQVDV